MRRSLVVLNRTIATLVLVAAIAGGFASVAHADDWARDDVAAQAVASLDPAIRTAIAARNLDVPPVGSAQASTPVVDQGFAWSAAALGLGVGIAAMCAVLGCVTLVRHDGRLRNA